jgi:TRAP-type C4-dicarboxylate transport system permease small subunit
MELITKLDRAFAKVEEVILALLLLGMVLVSALQVLLRNIWDTGIAWADSSLQNATLLLGLLGAAVATSEGRHLTIDIFSRLLKGRARFGLRVVIGCFSLFVCVVLAQGGWMTFKVNYTQWLGNVPSGWTIMHTLRQEIGDGNIPQWLSQAMLPVAFSLIAFHFALRLIRDLSTLTTGREWEKLGAAGPEGDAALDEIEARAQAMGSDPPQSTVGEATDKGDPR